MKIFITMFMFFGLLFSSDMKENATSLKCVECDQEASEDYCQGYADGLDEASGWNMTVHQ